MTTRKTLTPAEQKWVDDWRLHHTDAYHDGTRENCEHCQVMIAMYGPMPPAEWILGKVSKAAEPTVADRILTNPSRRFMQDVLVCHVVEEHDAIALTDQGGFIPTLAEFEELVNYIYRFYDATPANEIAEHNAEREENVSPKPYNHSSHEKEVPPPEPGYIYVIRAFLDRPRYKIGRTTNVPNRLRNLQTASPVPLTLMHSISVSDMARAEGLLHSAFAATRAIGEWFDLEDDVITRLLEATSEELLLAGFAR